jgi:hypothetical protein
VAAGVVVLFAAMPAGANAYIFAARYSQTSELRLGRRRHRHDPGGGDLACGSLVADRNSAIGSGPGWPGYREQQDVAWGPMLE